ncbi:MAG: DUF4282 domain-containing protein [Phycisphaeraceae bacterium]|nr:DUF4282 domain-containing protein [Phycisphaeraceae bacterium]
MDTPSNRPSGFSALLDFSFTHFITISFIKVIYLIAIVAILIGWLAMIVAGFASGGFLGGIGAIIVGAIVALFNLIMARVWLELIVVIFRIGDNTSTLVEMSRGRPPAAPMP